MISLPAIKLPRSDSSHFLFLHCIFLLVIFHSYCFPNLLKTFWVLGISPKLFATSIQLRNVPGFFWLPLLFSKSVTTWNGRDAPLWILIETYLVAVPSFIVHYRKISEYFSQLCAALQLSSYSQMDYLMGCSSVFHSSNLGWHQLVHELCVTCNL